MKILLTFWILSYTFAFAIVTIKPLDIGEKPPGYSGEVSFSWKLNKGNTNTNATSAGLYLQRDFNTSLIFVKASYEYGESLGSTYVDKRYYHARRIHQISKHFDDEVFTQQQSNTFTSLTSRTLAGAGLRMHNGDANSTGRFYFSAGAFYLTELESNLREQNYVRGNLYISYKFTPSSKNFTFSLVSYYQPRANNLSDYLQLSTAEFTTALSEELSLKFSISYNINSDPVEGVSPFDYSQTTALTYKF